MSHLNSRKVDMPQKLSVVIPAYNEEHTISEIVRRVMAVTLPDGMSCEVIIVNDGSTDRTEEILKGFPNNSGVRIFHQSNQGKTSALLKGIKESTGDIILIQDADLEYDPEEYPALLRPILDGKVSVVYGSRFMGDISGMHLVNRWANVFSNLTFRAFYGVSITDINTCFKIFRREAIEGFVITSRNFAFETEVTVKILKKGLKIQEVPIRYVARTHEEGKKINWPKALEMYWPIIKFRFCK